MPKAKSVVLGTNRPIRVKLPDVYWNILYQMASMEGRDIAGSGLDELAAEFIKRGIIEDALAEKFEGGYWGYCIVQGWLKELEKDPFYTKQTTT